MRIGELNKIHSCTEIQGKMRVRLVLSFKKMFCIYYITDKRLPFSKFKNAFNSLFSKLYLKKKSEYMFDCLF